MRLDIMSDFFSIIAVSATAQANYFFAIQQQAPLQTLADDIHRLEGTIDSIGTAALMLYDQNVRLISFDQQLGKLLGLTV